MLGNLIHILSEKQYRAKNDPDGQNRGRAGYIIEVHHKLFNLLLCLRFKFGHFDTFVSLRIYDKKEYSRGNI